MFSEQFVIYSTYEIGAFEGNGHGKLSSNARRGSLFIALITFGKLFSLQL